MNFHHFPRQLPYVTYISQIAGEDHNREWQVSVLNKIQVVDALIPLFNLEDFACHASSFSDVILGSVIDACRAHIAGAVASHTTITIFFTDPMRPRNCK